MRALVNGVRPLISTEAAGRSYLKRRLALYERLGGPEVGGSAPHPALSPEGRGF